MFLLVFKGLFHGHKQPEEANKELISHTTGVRPEFSEGGAVDLRWSGNIQFC